jgi:hypothetical protein
VKKIGQDFLAASVTPMWGATVQPDLVFCFIPRVARFFLVHDTQTGKMYQMNTKCNKISQIFVKYSKWPKNISTFSNVRPSKIYPNWYFWFEKKPSGNPV